MAKITKKDYIEELIDEIKKEGYEEKTFPSGTFYIKDKNDYSFYVYFVYNDTEFKQATYDEIEYNLKDRTYSISRNQKELTFSDDNLKRSFGRVDAEELSFLEVPGNEGFYQKCFNEIASMGCERTKMVSRFLVRLIEEYPVLERVHKAGFDISEVFSDIRDYKTTSLLEAFKFETKAQLKFYKESFNLSYTQSNTYGYYGGCNRRAFTASFIRNLKPEEIAEIKNTQKLCENLDKRYGLSKTGEIMPLLSCSYGFFKDTALAGFYEQLKNYGRNANRKRIIEYIGYECDVRQGLTSFRRTMQLYLDYVRMSNELGTKYDNYPKCLTMRHDIAAKYYSIICNGKLKEPFKKECEKVSYLEGEIKGTDWAIVIPKEPEDLIDEGEQLSHCVKSYIQTIANGECNIVFLRKAEELGEAVYTVELRANKIVQFAGYCNCLPDESSKEAIHKIAEKYNLEEDYE